MKLNSTKAIILLMIICFLSLSSPTFGQAFNIKVRGILLNYKNLAVPYAKVITKLILNNNSPREFIMYSDKGGNFEINCPKSFYSSLKKVKLEIISNIYQEKREEYTREQFISLNGSQQVFELTIKDISKIEWNSKEHLLLYVRPIDQQNLYQLIKNNNLTAADEYIINKIEPDMKKYAYGFLGIALFDKFEYQQSKIYFNKSKNNLYNNLKGYQLFKQKEYVKAFEFLKKGILTKKRANIYYKLASIFEEHGPKNNAIDAYHQSFTDFNNLMKSLMFKWDDSYVHKSFSCRQKLLNKYNLKTLQQSKNINLSNILKKASDYCYLLNDMALYYFNKEAKTNHIYFSRKIFNAMQNPVGFFQEFSPFKKIRFIHVENYSEYDLQLINKKDEEIIENRKPLFQKIDNKVHVEVPNYIIQKAFYGPVGLIGKEWQDAFTYKILKEDILFKRVAVVLESNPVQLDPQNRLSGKLWVDKENGSILRIQWSPYGINNRNDIKMRGMILDRKPSLTFITEYQVVKNGVRFPSKCSIIESYEDSSGDKYTRIKTDIIYKDYKFFIINMDTIDVKSKDDL